MQELYYLFNHNLSNKNKNQEEKKKAIHIESILKIMYHVAQHDKFHTTFTVIEDYF